LSSKRQGGLLKICAPTKVLTLGAEGDRLEMLRVWKVGAGYLLILFFNR
jgi:hypothetical protein